MIYDKLENINKYLGICKNLDTAINFIHTTNLKKLPLGKTEIDGKNVFVNVMDATTRTNEAADFETHSLYMDLQTDIKGSEVCETCIAKGKQVKAYDNESDIALYKGAAFSKVKVDNKSFAIFMVNELHKPTLSVNGNTQVKKAVFKILNT